MVVTLVAVVVPAVLALAGRTSDTFGDSPEGFPLFAQDGVAFRYPPGWVVERTAAGWRDGGTVVAVLRPDEPPRRGGPVVVLRRFAPGQLDRQLERVARRLTVGAAFEENGYDTDVAGASRSASLDVVAKRRDGSMHRVSTVAAQRPSGAIFFLSARGPVADGRDDPRRVAASLSLDP